jgi:hypothetical protein
METEISRRAKDIIQKYASGLFKDSTLDFYGIKTAKIKEMINIEFPVIEVKDSGTDILFLLEDDTILHFEFQTTYSKEDIIRFAKYDLRIYEREGRLVITIIIYVSGVEEADTELRIGSLVYKPEKIMMADYNGNTIYAELDKKIKAGQELTDVDILNLLFLPLMKTNIPRAELAVNSIKMAQSITDKTKRDACIAAAFAFAGRYLNESDINKILEAIKMTDLAVMLLEEGMQKGITRTARNALKKGYTSAEVSDITGLGESEIQQLLTELESERFAAQV